MKYHFFLFPQGFKTRNGQFEQSGLFAFRRTAALRESGRVHGRGGRQQARPGEAELCGWRAY